MRKDEAIERLCKLITKVGNALDHECAHDCICGDNPMAGMGSGPVVDEDVIALIEDAVDNMLKHC